ncbi:MAG: ATP synthase F1 subunit gamma [bacterium]|nr:ATP synthase F1 subunit gamma [bacterium]
MANLKILKRRIQSIRNSAKMTRTMSMVAASKMRKAQDSATKSRPYVELFSQSISNLVANGLESSDPRLTKNASKTVSILVLSTDKGLCGSLNTNLFKSLEREEAHIESKELVSKKDFIYYPIGKKITRFLDRTQRRFETVFTYKETVNFEEVKEIGKVLGEKFLEGEIGSLYILFPHFVSSLIQLPRALKLLPFEPIAKEDASPETTVSNNFVFEPKKKDVIAWVLNHYFEVHLFQAFLEAKASEHTSRMIAMQNATSNAEKLSEELTLLYNRVRQEAITRELLERSFVAE